MTRDEMLELLEAIEEPILMNKGGLVGAWEIEIACENGVFQDPSPCEILEGPFCLSSDRMKLATKAVRWAQKNDEEPDEPDDWDSEVEWEEALRMARAGCKPGQEYYRENQHEYWDEDGNHVYHVGLTQAEAAVVDRWVVESSGLQPWEDMDDEELRQWIEDLGLGPQ